MNIGNNKILFMKLFLFVLMILNGTFVFSQGEETGPLISNPYIKNISSNALKNNLKSSTGTFDSTFIYYSDTLDIPFFDDFSKNKFQQYDTDFSDPGVTFDKKFHLLDNTTLLPLHPDSTYTTQVTYRRTYSIDNLTYTDENFAPKQIKIGSLSTYPVNYTTINVYPPYYIYDSLGNPDDLSDTAKITNPDIVQDSATQFFYTLNDPNAYWLDSYAYHNYRYAVNPWSIGVATLDGLDENGRAYLIGSTANNYGDYLTSKPIDLSTYTASDSVYFSFLYQPGGFGDQPETSDSLVLEFYSDDLDIWNRVWSDSGFISNDFKVGHICLTNAQYFNDGFQFRFKNYGNLSGGFDHFNIDYVHLRSLSGQQDTLFKDFAWVYPISTLLKDYTSVPWDHYKNSPDGKMSDEVNLVIRNGSNIPENNSTNGQVKIDYQGLNESIFTIPGNALSGGSLNYAPRTTYSTLHDLSGGYEYDENKLGTKASFDITGVASSLFPNFNGNDSTFSQQVFENYYSYDDGTAEVAYGTIGAQSRLAIKFEPYESDSLIGIMTNFVESGNDVSNKLFLLTVWDNNNGIPGNVLYKDSIFFPRTPQYGDGINNFYTYYFDQPDEVKVKVNGTFFIGWQQFDMDRLNIGFDRNLINNDKTYYSLDGGTTWINSTVQGTVMMRPVFSTAMDPEFLGIQENDSPKINDFTIYPNPTNDIINIRMNQGQYHGCELYNLQGKLIHESNDTSLDLSNYPSGVYFIKVNKTNNTLYKVIKY